MRWWEIQLIVRGFRRRNVLQYQLQRLTAYASMFCMGNPQHKTPEDLTGKLYFDRYIEYLDGSPLTDEEILQMQAEMAAINAQSKPPQPL